MKPQFTPQAARPLSSQTYRAAAKKLRAAADKIEERAVLGLHTPQHKRAVTRVINSVAGTIRTLRAKHLGSSEGGR